MISHYAQRVPSASVLAWVTASCVHTCLALLAISADKTFGSAAWWDSEITGQARAGGLVAEFATHAVRSAGRGLAGFDARYRDVRRLVGGDFFGETMGRARRI
jgi:hypothetical protein